MLGQVLKSLIFDRAPGPLDRCQPKASAAVVLQTVLRPSLEKAVRSVFEQDLRGRIHLLIGVDKRLGDPGILQRLVASCPPFVGITLFDPGYSTSLRHGGVYSNYYGGALRTILSFAANSRYVSYLDDDDWYDPNHLSSLLEAINGKKWAFSHRWFVNPFNLESMCIDTIENLGPGAGIYAQNYGGFACPSSLMIDKIACSSILHLWSAGPGPHGDMEDRVFFKALCDRFNSYGATNKATVRCVIKPEDEIHQYRERALIEAGYPIERLRSDQNHSFGRV